MEVAYISYEEAQKLIPFFKAAIKNSPYKEAVESARRILRELEYIRDRNYSPLRGGQCIFSREEDKDWLLQVLHEYVYKPEDLYGGPKAEGK